MKVIIRTMVSLIAFAAFVIGAELVPVDLRCDSLKNPLGLDAAKPRLSWKFEDEGQKSELRGVKQTAYHVLVASSEELLTEGKADLWDSGKVQSDQSLYVSYGGKLLESRMRCFWRVRVWLERHGSKGEPSVVSAWSEPATWTMALMKSEEWKADWISASRWFMEPRFRPPGFIAVGAPSWAQVDLGKPVRIDTVRLYPQTPGEFPLRFKIEADDDIDFNHPKIIADHSGENFEPVDQKMVEFSGKELTASRVRLIIIAPPQGKPQTVIRQMEVLSDGRNVALMRPTLASGHNWHSGHVHFMVDGMPSANDGNACPEDACPNQTAPLLRKAFALDQPVKRAILYYAAHGMAELSINGNRVEESVLGPRFSDYGKRIYYRTVDVSRLLNRGENVVGAMLGNGFFSPPNRGFGQRHNGHGQPRLLVQLEIELADGTRRMITSDESWRWARSEVVSNDLWDNYTEDRRQAKPGWDKPDFVDDAWRGVGVLDSIGGKLCAAPGIDVRVLGTLEPDRIEGNTAVFETLSSGWPRLEIKHGKAGQTIRMRGDHGVPCQFTLAEDGPAVLEPRFIWGSGPLRLTVEGLNEPLAKENIRIQRVGADFALAGSFKCSNPWLNTLHENVLRTHRNYCLDFPLDPMREKQGWTQDAQNFFNTAAYLTDSNEFYRQWWRDMADNQRPNGLLGSIMPLMGQAGNDWNCPWWSGMIAWLPWEHYLYYGDRKVLEDAYEPMRRYVDFLDRTATLGAGTRPLDYPDPHFFLNADAARERLLIWSGANDWMHPDNHIAWYASTPTGPLVNMAGWYHFANVVHQTAVMLGRTEDAAKYGAMARDIAKRSNDKYLDRNTGLYGKQANDQTAQVLPLAVGMVPPDIIGQTRQRLLDAIGARKDHHATGFVALPYLLRLLTEMGEGPLANRIVNQSDYPSWKTLMHHGVLAEDWRGGGAQMPSCGGAVGMWLYQSVLGIRPDPAGPGFKKFILAPQPDPGGRLTEADGFYDSPYGRIVSRWKHSGKKLIMNVSIPPNTTATVHVPAKNEADVEESGMPARKAMGVKFLRMEKGKAVFEVGSGSYEFASNQMESGL